MSHTVSEQIPSHLSNCVCIIHFFFKERNGSVDVVFMRKDPKLEIKMRSIQTGGRDAFMYLLDGKKNLSILSKLLLGWLRLMPLSKINKKKFYSNNPPCSKKLRKLGSFLYMDNLLFKEGTERLKRLKSFTSCRGKFYTNTCMWWVHVICKQLLNVCFSHSCPFHPISHLRKPCSWALSLQTGWIKLSIGQKVTVLA